MNIQTANRLYQYRKQHNLSQEELANKIGVSRQAVSKWERAEASPDTDNLILLSKIYGVTLDEMLQEGDVADSPDFASDSTDDSSTSDNNTESPADSDTNNTEYVKQDHVSFKNGIHVDSKDGDTVHIGFNGIHVHDKHGAKVDIDGNGVFVEENNGNKKVYTDENGNVYYDKETEHQHKDKTWVQIFPFPIIVTILFLIWSIMNIWGGVAVAWILFLTIPLYYSLADAIKKRKPDHFAYPVLVTMVYLFIGVYAGLWHPWWILFVTIPVYYSICEAYKKAKKHKKKQENQNID